jgi:hypothetical protein
MEGARRATGVTPPRRDDTGSFLFLLERAFLRFPPFLVLLSFGLISERRLFLVG